MENVTVLMATYNGSQWINEQLVSLGNQINVNINLVVSDDYSSDDTLSKINCSSLFSSVKITKPLSRVGYGGQNFISLIKNVDILDSGYVALCDQDDIWMPNKLENAIIALKSSGCVAYSCPVIAFWPDGSEKLLTQARVTTAVDFLFEGGGQGCTFVLDVNFFRCVKEFCISNAELVRFLHYHDWLIYFIARSNYKRWYFDNKPYLKYRQHLFNDTGARAGLNSIFKRFNLIRSGWYENQVKIFSRLLLKIIESNNDEKNGDLMRLITSVKSFDRFKLATYLLKNGRRKQVDRFVLFFAVIFGWLKF